MPGAAGAAPDLELASAGLDRRSVDALRKLRESVSPSAVLARLDSLQIQALTREDDEYPRALTEVADPPPVLFVRGRLDSRDHPAVALVGTRRASAYGLAVADRLARDLAAAGVTVVSGLAKGVDTSAHKAALDAGGRTLAVLGNGLDQVYPPENGQLARRIADTDAGALISEFAPGVPPDAVNFPRRNRIISGLSAATVIVEAGEKSGALITADFALEQGREVLAVPGPIFGPGSVGANELLKQGATPVTSADDVLRVIEAERASTAYSVLARELPNLDVLEAAVLEAIGGEPRHIDEIMRAAGVQSGEALAAITALELTGLARQVGPMLYTRT